MTSGAQATNMQFFIITYTAEHIWYAAAPIREDYARAVSTFTRSKNIILHFANISEIAGTPIVVVYDVFKKRILEIFRPPVTVILK